MPPILGGRGECFWNMTACLQVAGMPFLCMVCRNGIVCGVVAGYHKQMVCGMRPGGAGRFFRGELALQA